MHGHCHRGDGEGWGGGNGDPRRDEVVGVAAVSGVFVAAVVILLVSSEGARVAVRLAAALGEAGERLRRPAKRWKQNCFMTDIQPGTWKRDQKPWQK